MESIILLIVVVLVIFVEPQAKKDVGYYKSKLDQANFTIKEKENEITELKSDIRYCNRMIDDLESTNRATITYKAPK